MNNEIENYLPISKIYQEDYDKKIINGQNLLQQSNIVLVSLVRNIGSVLDENIKGIVEFFNLHSKTFKYVFFENDSIDNTKEILQQYQKTYPDIIHVLSEDLNRTQYGPVKDKDRIQALSEYRNKAKLYASQFESDYIIILDMDFISISLNGILNSFGWMSEHKPINAIAGNSFQYRLSNPKTKIKNLWNYDSWAYRGSWWHDLQYDPPSSIHSIDPMLWFGLCVLPRGSTPTLVNSAFGGCCIYESKFYKDKDLEYKSYDCEHVTLHYQLCKKYSNFKLFLNPSQIMLFE